VFYDPESNPYFRRRLIPRAETPSKGFKNPGSLEGQRPLHLRRAFEGRSAPFFHDNRWIPTNATDNRSRCTQARCVAALSKAPPSSGPSVLFVLGMGKDMLQTRRPIFCGVQSGPKKFWHQPALSETEGQPALQQYQSAPSALDQTEAEPVQCDSDTMGKRRRRQFHARQVPRAPLTRISAAAKAARFIATLSATCPTRVVKDRWGARPRLGLCDHPPLRRPGPAAGMNDPCFGMRFCKSPRTASPKTFPTALHL